MSRKIKPDITWPTLTGDLKQTWPGKRWWQKPGPWCRFKGRLGRRGAMMLLLGATYMIIGYGELTRPTPDIPGAFHLWVAPLVRSVGWAITGLLAVVFALGSRHSFINQPARWWWHGGDTPGWVALYLMPTIYICSFARSWFLWEVTDHAKVPPAGDPMAWYNAALRVPFVLVVVICSGWLENPRRGCP